MESQFVPKPELERLHRGSHEYFISEVTDAVARAGHLFGEGAKPELVSTFPTQAIVCVESKGYYRVRVVRNKDNKLEASNPEQINVPVYKSDNIRDYLKQEAGSIVSKFLNGSKVLAEDVVRDLVDLVPAEKPLSETELTAIAVAAVKADRPWKRLFVEKQLQIKKIAGEVPAEVEPKFERIVSGAVPLSALSEYKSLVHSALAELHERIAKLLESIEARSKQAASQKFDSNAGALLVSFASFAEDLKSDLRQVHRSIRETVSRVNDIRSLAELHDVAALELNQYVIATRFIENVLNNLKSE